MSSGSIICTVIQAALKTPVAGFCSLSTAAVIRQLENYKAPRGSESSFEELDTSGVDWRYLPLIRDVSLEILGLLRCSNKVCFSIV